MTSVSGSSVVGASTMIARAVMTLAMVMSSRSMGDPERYRKADEVHRWQEEDPIGIFRKFIIDQKLAGEEELNALDDQALAVIADATAFAEASPEPGAEELFQHIYADAVVEG